MLYRDNLTLHSIHFHEVCGDYGKEMVMKESVARYWLGIPGRLARKLVGQERGGV